MPDPAISSTSLPGALPTSLIPPNTDIELVSTHCLSFLYDLKPHHLAPDSFWRDFLCLTGTLRTLHTCTSISQIWLRQLTIHGPKAFRLVQHSSQIVKLSGGKGNWITARFRFETTGPQAAQCLGLMNLVPFTKEGGSVEWRIWTLSTILDAFTSLSPGTPDVMIPALPSRFRSGTVLLDAAVIGAGMAGLCTGARLQALGLAYTIFDRNAQVGDNWTSRYDSCKLHLSREYMEMPFGRMYSGKGYFLTAQELAEGMRDFVRVHGLKVEMKRHVESACWNSDARAWRIEISDGQGGMMTVMARHLVMALGGGVSEPFMPTYDGIESFEGDILHSVHWKNAKPWKGKRGIAIGSANTAFDIVADMVHAGLEGVTMVQRSATHVIPDSHFRNLLDGLYTPHSDIELVDRLTMGIPYSIGRLTTMAITETLIDTEVGRYDALSAAGFKVKTSPDLYACVSERLGSHYLDVGGTRLIESGDVQVKSDSLPVSYIPKGLKFMDGSTIDADVIVFCTGFSGSMRNDVAKIVGAALAEQLDDFWGLNKEGQYRGLAVPIGHPGIWFIGGGNSFSRFMSRFIALQIKADVSGSPFQPMEEDF